jgi:hypothetical protein
MSLAQSVKLRSKDIYFVLNNRNQDTKLLTSSLAEVYLEKSLLKVTEGKTRTSIRTVQLSERVRPVLQYRLNKFKAEYLFRPAGKTFRKRPIA